MEIKNDVASDPELGKRNLAQYSDDDRRHDSGDDWKVRCPQGGADHLVLDVVTNRFSDFSGHSWNDVSRGLLRWGILPNYYVVQYEYTDEAGKKLYVHGKMRPREQGKASDWTHGYDYASNGVPVLKKGKGATNGIRRVLFDLPLLKQSPKVWMTAGEKDAELLRHRFEKNATTRPFGEQHWDDGYFQQLEHATSITVVIDNDDAGYRGGWTVYSKLVNRQVKLRVVRPHDSVKDLFDHVNYGHELADLIPVDIKELEERGSKPKGKSDLEHFTDQLKLAEIDVTDDAVAIRNIAETINAGTFPEMYQQNGVLYRIQGEPSRGPLTVNECGPADLRALLSEYTFTYKLVSAGKESSGGSGTKMKPMLPSESLCRAVLKVGKWRVPQLELNPGRYELRVPEGTLNMLTGSLRESTYADMHTCQTKVSYKPESGMNCPMFLKTLSDQLSSPEDVECALDGLAYALTGDTSWQLFYWWQGVPGSGKSTIALTLHEMLGSYSVIADDDLLFGSRETHPANIIRLEGKRLVIQDEIPERRQLKIERLRQHTTLPTIPGRGMGQNFRDVGVSWKLLFTSNPKARITSQGKDGIWRRMVLLHCESAIPSSRRRKFFHRTLLKEEGPQILNLLLERIPRIRDTGPQISENVREEVSAYEEETDLTAQFMSLIDRSDSNAWISNKDLQHACEVFSGSEPPILNRVQLGLAMHEAGFIASEQIKCKQIDRSGERVRPAKSITTGGWIGAAIPEGVIGFENRWVPMNPDSVKPKRKKS